MSEEPIDDIELEEAEPVDESFLDVSLVEEVNSNSQENYCCVVANWISVISWKMSGIRNFGQVWDGTSERGFFDPLKSRVFNNI
jgi:hypothetical protein